MSFKYRRVLFLALLLACVSLGWGAAPNHETLFQRSTLDALLAGLYDGTMSLKDLKAQGNLGLGTFDRLDGEMVVLDGIVYQITADGAVHVPSEKMTTPFACVTYFEPEFTLKIEAPTDMDALMKAIDGLLPSPNYFYAIRVEGQFAAVKTRSVPPQQQPYPPLTEVVAEQPTFALENLRGTLVGFRAPAYVKGINVPGYHLHFLDAAKKRGGHVLACTLVQGTVTVDLTPAFMLSLPPDEAFKAVNLSTDRTQDTHTVEKDK